MTDKVKQLAPQIWAEIEKANNILLHCHRSPDGDSLGSALATMFVLKDLGKNVMVIAGDSEKPDFLSALPGFDEIKPLDYFQIDITLFDLFLILDSNKIDRVSNKNKIDFPAKLKTINIDHHPDNTGFADITLLDTTYPATSQMMFDLFTLWKVKISSDTAKCLMAGIYTDTGGFKYPPVNQATFDVAGQLANIAPDFTKTIFELENSNTPTYVRYLAAALGSVEEFFSKNVAISSLDFETLQKNDLSEKSISKAEISTLLRSVKGWSITICMTESEKGHVGISMRTRNQDKYDLTKVAKQLDGGGHPAASGASIKKPMAEAKKILLETIKNIYPELGNP